MKTVGLIGGMSWESSLLYYKIMNELVKERLGGLHSCQSLMYSVDFADIEALQSAGDWDRLTDCMVEAALRLTRGGAEAVLIATNTMHKCAPQVQAALDAQTRGSVPLLHIADAAGQRLKAAGIARAGLLGTRYTMEMDFYSGRLAEKFGIDTVIPGEADRGIVHDVIYGELVRGVVRQESRREYARIMAALAEQGAQGVILGCTEIPLLVQPGDTPLPLFDTTRIHAEAAVDFALAEA